MDNLFRFRQDIFREFSNILGSLFEPNLPVSPVVKGLPDPLLKKSGGGGGDSGGKGGVGSIDGNKLPYHQSRAPTLAKSPHLNSDPFKRNRG